VFSFHENVTLDVELKIGRDKVVLYDFNVAACTGIIGANVTKLETRETSIPTFAIFASRLRVSVEKRDIGR
jgi:hypothetical protein